MKVFVRSVRSFLIGFTVVLMITQAGFAQQAQEVFGKNRQQFRVFDWQYLSGENFDIYYYDARRGIAQEALQYIELEFDRVTDLIGYPPYFKTKIFLYNSLADLRQSNVGLNQNNFSVGGETEFIKPYIEVAHMGTSQELKEELLFKVTELMLNEMMYGGNLRDVFQSALLMNLPDWFVSGAALYVAYGWTAEMDDYIRQIIKMRNVKRINRFSGREAALVGQSLWNFIVERYGKSSLSNILNYTRVTRNEEKSMLITLGVNYNQLVSEWQQFYGSMDMVVSKSYVTPADSMLLYKGRQHHTTEFTTIKISPDGRYLAYAENDRGRFVVKVRELNSNKETVVLSGGTRVVGQRVDYRLPIISWADANTLGVVGVKRGEYTFWLYDLNTKTKLPRELDKFSNVRSINFSSNGRLAIVSADFEGQNDLFLVSTRRDRVRRLTNDIYDDLDPAFIPGTNRIVFSSNRVSDTLQTNRKIVLGDLTDNYNLYVFDLDTTNQIVTKITNTLSKDFAPIAVSETIYYYLSDQRGIINLFKFDRTSGIYTQVTNYAASVRDYDFSFEKNLLVFTQKKKSVDQIFLDRNFNFNKSIFTPPTRRKELQQVKIIQDRKKQEETKAMSIKDLINARLKESQPKEDSVPVKQDTVSVSQDSIPIASDSVVVSPDTLKQKKEPVINTDNYVFDDEVVKQVRPTESFLNRYIKARDKSRITGPFPYESKFSADNLVTSFVIDPLRGFGVLLEAQMNDMLENYRFFGGLMTTIDLRNGDAFVEYQYLPALVDFSARFDRKGIRWEPYSDGNIYHYSSNKLEIGGALPITDRVRFTVKPFGMLTRSVNQGTSSFPLNPPSEIPNNHWYAGFKSELVYDNSIASGLNIIEGTRGKLTFTTNQGLDVRENSFSQVSVDIRHYQKIYKEIVFAVRGFGGSFFGQSPKQYLLGGMDNWAFNNTYLAGRDSEGNENTLGSRTENQDILFVEYATNLRGFPYSTLFGHNVVLMNAELRLPLIRALSSSPISSNFFKNMQLIAFYDIGTSWSGKPPFNTGNSVRIDRITNGPFEIDIKNYLNPWLYSYGFGMRSVMLGYYMKFDLAWPVENYQVSNPQFMFTLGFDF